MNDVEEYYLQHFGVKGMKWGVRKKRETKGNKAKSKREIRKENRELARKKNNPTGISTRKLIKERVRIAEEEHVKAKKDIEETINKELTDLANFAKKNGLDQDDGGGGNNEKASREYQRRLSDLEYRTYDLTRTINARTSRRLIEEYGDTAVKSINDANRRKQMAVLAAPLAMSLGSVALLSITQSSHDDDVLQHYGVKGMKWGVRKKRDPAKAARKKEAKQAKKAERALYKDAKRDLRNVNKGYRSFNLDRAKNAERTVRRKSKEVEGYKEANKKAQKNAERWAKAGLIAGAVNVSFSVAMIKYPGAMMKGADVLEAVLSNGASKVAGSASTAGMYAKYAAKAAVPVSRTVKNRGYIEAILVNSGNALKVVG